MTFNWRKLFNILGKAAEVAAPIVEKKNPAIGAILKESGQVVEQATEEKPKETIQ